MRFTFLFLLCAIVFFSCKKDEDPNPIEPVTIDYKQEMRNFVQELSTYAKSKNPNFLVIPQNGQELVTINGEEDASIDLEYLAAIDALGREDLFYGYNADNTITPAVESEYIIAYLDKAKAEGKTILVTDYTNKPNQILDAYTQHASKDFVGYVAESRELDIFPQVSPNLPQLNTNAITNLGEVKNFNYLLNTSNWSFQSSFITDAQNTNSDLLITDPYFHGEDYLATNSITGLKVKANGGKRLLIAYLSIGEAEDYRKYWQQDWQVGSPDFISAENPDWQGNYKVKYWEQDWKNLIFGSEDAFLDSIIALGFDGVYLDIIDAFEYWEEQ